MNFSSYPNSSPFANFNGENNSTKNSGNNNNNNNNSNTFFNGITGMFSSKADTLPFSYADQNHTKVSSAPPASSNQSSSNPSSWLPAFLTSSPLGTPSLATSTPLTATQEWIETFGLTRTQRYTAFAICIVAAVFLFFLAMFHLPFVVIRPGKFVVPYCMGSMFILVSFGFLHGFVSYSKHLMSSKKAPYSAWFILSTIGTLYAALKLKSYILTVLFAVIQMAGMLTFAVSYIPGGSSGISFMSSMITSSIKSRFSPNSF